LPDNDFYHWDGNNLILNVRLQPKSSHDKIAGIENGYLKIRITTPPIDGKANKHLIKVLAKLFSVAPSTIQLLNGETAREKRLCIPAPNQLPDLILPPKK